MWIGGTYDLDTLLAGPARGAEIPADAIPALLAQYRVEHARLSAVEQALIARLVEHDRQNGTNAELAATFRLAD